MAKLQHGSKGKMKFVLNDVNGTATGTISFVDGATPPQPTAPAAGATVATSLSSNNPGVNFTVDATGLIVTATPATPLPTPLPTGVIVTASVTITNTDGSTVALTCDNSADPMNVVAGGPAGAQITFA